MDWDAAIRAIAQMKLNQRLANRARIFCQDARSYQRPEPADVWPKATDDSTEVDAVWLIYSDAPTIEVRASQNRRICCAPTGEVVGRELFTWSSWRMSL